MKIGIFETEHFEGSYPVIKLFDYNNNDITVFAYEQAYEQFKHLFPEEPKRYTWKVKPEKRSKHLFILDMYREIKKNNISLVYLNTVSNNFFVYALMVFFLRRVRVVLTIHNINTWFEYKRSFSFRRIVRYLGRKLLISVVRDFNVVALTMIHPLEKKLGLTRKVHCLPGAVFEADNIKQTQADPCDRINIVIPGAVDGRRRNYQAVFDLITVLETEKLPATIIFLGRFYEEYGANILQRCSTWPQVHTELNYYEFEIVDQPEFDRVMNKASCVFIPSVLQTIIEDGVTEFYGTTISSGNLFDVIKHAKPFIIPRELPVDHFLERSCFRYKNTKDIVQLISTLHQQPGYYAEWLKSAMQSSGNYTMEKVRERNPGLFTA